MKPLSIEDTKFGAQSNFEYAPEAVNTGDFFYSNHPCGILTGVSSLLCLLSSGLLSVLKRKMSWTMEKGQGQGKQLDNGAQRHLITFHSEQ